MKKRHALRVLICCFFLCNIEALAGGALRAQRVAPVGVRWRLSGGIAATATNSTLPLVVVPRKSDSAGTARMQHAVVGMALGIVVGAAIGYQHGKSEDARCAPDCGGPQIATLVDPLFYGLVGGVVGAIVGYILPTRD